MSINKSDILTDNSGKDANEINAEKGENVLHIDKNGAEELKKIKNTLNSKKTWATRELNTLDKRAKAFKDSAAKHNREHSSNKSSSTEKGRRCTCI